MMRSILLAVSLFLISGFVWSDSGLRETGVAYYFPFDLNPTVPLPEDAVATHGCKYTIAKSDFLNSFLTKKSDVRLSMDYRHLDAKSIVVIRDDIIWTPFFISRKGIVRHGDDYYRVNKEKFEKALVFVGCPFQVLYDNTLHIEFSYPRKLSLWIVNADEKNLNLFGGVVFPPIQRMGRQTKIKFDVEVSFEINSVYIKSGNRGFYINGNKVEDTVRYISVDKDGAIFYNRYVINLQCDDEIGALCDLAPPLENCSSNLPRVCSPP